jgi:hypothetical protein
VHIFFDVDYTILGLDGSLRPHTAEVFKRLVDDGHELHIWSGHGLRFEEIRRHRLDHLVSGCYHKPLTNHLEALDELGVPLIPDFVVDDARELPAAFGGVWVTAYAAGTPSDYLPPDSDREMQRVYRVVQEYVATGTSSDRRFFPSARGVPRPR